MNDEALTDAERAELVIHVPSLLNAQHGVPQDLKDLALALDMEGNPAQARALLDGMKRLSAHNQKLRLDKEHRQKVEDEVSRLKVQQEANRRISAETHTGTREVSWDDLFACVEWLVQGLIAVASLAFLVARPNLGKTFAMLDMCLNLALGRPWLGRETRQSKVMFVLGEGLSGFGDRIRAWCSYNGADLAEVLQQIVIIDGACLTADPSLATLKEVADRKDVGLIVFDTYAATSGVSKEDDAALNQAVVLAAREIRPTASVLFLHHPNKATEASACPIMRGSSALHGTADTVMTMWRDTGYTKEISGDDSWFALSTDNGHGGKSRHSGTQTIRGLQLVEHGPSAVLIRDERLEAPLSRADAQISQHFAHGMTTADFAQALGESTQGCGKKLNASQLVKKVPDTFPQQWTWTAKGEDLKNNPLVRQGGE